MPGWVKLIVTVCCLLGSRLADDDMASSKSDEHRNLENQACTDARQTCRMQIAITKAMHLIRVIQGKLRKGRK